MDLPLQIRDAMVAHALFCIPEEACGLIAADDQGRMRMVYCLTNVDRSAATYTLDPVEHFRAMRHAESNGWHLAGVFHSHTNTAAYPSRTDVAKALEPDWLYMLVGLGVRHGPEVRGFWIRDGNIAEVPLVVMDSREDR